MTNGWLDSNRKDVPLAARVLRRERVVALRDIALATDSLTDIRPTLAAAVPH